MNTILILADQLSAKWLGCYGCKAAYTPNLDALAARGTRFSRCYSNHPVCMPARASIITGRSAQHHGVFYNGFELDSDLPTYPKLLQKNNVQTLGIGKFHLECHGRSAYNDVCKYGFDRAETTEDIRAGNWLDWVKSAHPEHYEKALATVWSEPHLAEYGPGKIDLRPALEAAREKYPRRDITPMTHASIIPEEACQTRWIAERAMALLAERDPDRPFFLNMSFVDPHDPYDPPPRFLDLINHAAIPVPVCSEDAALGRTVQPLRNIGWNQRFAGCSRDDWLSMRHYYLASLAFLDEQVGRLMTWLQEQGLLDHTLVMFSADHGDMLGDHGFATKGAWHFDACMRVPLIAAGPGVQTGVCERVVSLLDLFPTIVDYADAAPDAPLEGMSLRPLLQGSNDLDRKNAALVESYGSYGEMDYGITARTVVTPDTAYTRFGSGQRMLFDLDSDPDERINLANNPEAGDREVRMQDLMLELTAKQNYPLPNRNLHPFARH